VWLIKDLKIYVHGIIHIITFIVLQNIVVESSYSMLLGRSWLRDAKMAHDWGSNIVTIQGNGTIRTIIITIHLGGEEEQRCYYVTIIRMASHMKKKISSFLQSHNCSQ